MKIRKPAALKPGDSIGVISPASPLFGEKYDAFLEGVEYLKSRGYEIVKGSSIADKNGYLAGSDQQRAHDINRMFSDPQIKVILASRGGYGTPRILNAIDYKIIRKQPKWLVGYSDITALQLALFKKAGLVSLSGPMVAVDLKTGMDTLSEKSFWHQLSGSLNPELFFSDIGGPVKVYRQGVARGRLIGGCMTVLTGLLGTAFMPNFKNSILFLEDVGEDLYKIDRLFAQLKNSGVLYKIKGLILGQFKDCVDKMSDNPVDLDDIIEHYIADLTIPVIGNVFYGHADIKISLPLGIESLLDTNQEKLTYMESLVNGR